MKTYINYEKKDCINHLNDAISILNQTNQVYISIPSDFSYANALDNDISVVRDTRRELTMISQWLSQSQFDYQRSVDELNIQLNRVTNETIKPYVSKINE